MDATTKGALIEQGGKLLAEGIRLLASRPAARKADSVPVASESVTRVVPKEVKEVPNQSGILLPTKQQTLTALKRRLAKELYKAELDLAAGLLIANRPCSCLDGKHPLELEAASEELIPEEPGNTVYQDIIQWLRDNQHKVTVAAIASGHFKQEYPRMAAEFRDFRKRVMGSVAESDRSPAPPAAAIIVGPMAHTSKLTLDQAEKMAADEAVKVVRREWNSVEKT